MTLKVLFLGRLQDAAGAGERMVEYRRHVAGLIDSFEPALAAALRSPKVRVAVNGAIGASVLTDGDEVAFLPPVSGG
ncbi:MoaD/ThiS family protein [Novosphingobium sp. Gsoil 351]|uniref:MoaD/ThiS family protein n=1 Tax=Novosphingobium sp. Gsoil 351 TaxID=2675225 RepID=UPI0012B477F2|nr:MoaD/ThiS family protein [Novosphingobium sp. Gsoil 351]QGN54398.1 MoaD/ThiS family protein [Novosphingobium sp. Gsoil 351]